MSANLERIQAKAANKRLELTCERSGGVSRYRLVDTKHGTLAFKCTSRAAAEEFIDARCIEVAAR